jgi:UDP-N-acetylmuramoyl-L-alanyl-D-glutamate--2,6-diaminopimelate ligase
MRIDDLLEGLDLLDFHNLFEDMEVTSITCDSREARPGCLFVAIPGTHSDGHDHIPAALAAGATVIVQSRPLEHGNVGSFLRVASSRAAYAQLCARFENYPSRRLRVIAVTGTNGKTSTTLITRHLLLAAGHRPAALGTLGLLRHDSERFESTGLTTPDAGRLQRLMRELLEQGATHLVMEVSSHALVQDRVLGVDFAGGVFTNLTQDHLDFHETMEAYRDAKQLLFTRYLPQSGGYAVINGDDATGAYYAAAVTGISGIVYGTSPDHNLVMRDISTSVEGTGWEVVVKNGKWPEVLERGVNVAGLRTKLVGEYHAYNCTAALGVALFEGMSLEQAAAALPSFAGVPGRLERIDNPKGINVYVDYAHTPDALDNVLSSLARLRPAGGRIITVFGCGGDRDPGKRPKMGAAAQQGSDVLVVTSDNPRSERPEHIIDQIYAGLQQQNSEIYREADRRSAIHMALSLARPRDIVLIAGKGHEDYQILKDRTIHFSDAEEVREFLATTAV